MYFSLPVCLWTRGKYHDTRTCGYVLHVNIKILKYSLFFFKLKHVNILYKYFFICTCVH